MNYSRRLVMVPVGTLLLGLAALTRSLLISLSLMFVGTTPTAAQNMTAEEAVDQYISSGLLIDNGGDQAPVRDGSRSLYFERR